MERIEINSLIDLFREYEQVTDGEYKVEFISDKESIYNSHAWMKNQETGEKKAILDFITITDEVIQQEYQLGCLPWNSRNVNDYYIVVFKSVKNGPLVELHNIEQNCLVWKYRPVKQDNQNDLRKAKFAQIYGDTVALIEIPKNVEQIRDFIKEIFELVNIRIQADDLTELQVEQKNTGQIKEGFPEGKLYEAKHRRRERNGKAIRQIKEAKYKANNKLTCEVCGFDFQETYGEIGTFYIEAHHTIPVSELKDGDITKPEDIVLVCSNCHSMLHRKRPWLTINEIKNLLKV